MVEVVAAEGVMEEVMVSFVMFNTLTLFLYFCVTLLLKYTSKLIL